MASLRTVPVLLLLAIGLLRNHVAGVITDARLVYGSLPIEGTVELEVNGMWYRTCGVNFDTIDGVFICKHLNFAGLNRVFKMTPYPTPSSTTSPLRLQCDNTDSGLANCGHPQVSGPPPCSGEGGIKCYDQTYLGCYVDSSNDRLFNGAYLMNASMTIDTCINYCDQSTAGKYVYAGLEFGKECYCGTADEDYTRSGQREDIQCQFVCGGSNMDSCGGSGNMAVFRIPMMTTPQEETTTVPTSAATQGSVTTVKHTMHTGDRMNQGQGGGGGGGGGSDIAVYAGAGAAAFVIIIIVIIIVACLVKRRSQYSEKPREKQPGAEPPSFPVFGKGGGGGGDGRGDSSNDYNSFYHDVNFDREQTISSGVQNYSEVNHDDYDAAAIYHNDAMEMEVIKNGHSAAANGHAADLSKSDPPAVPAGRGEQGQDQHPYANANAGVADDFAALYATPDKSGGNGAERQQGQERELSGIRNQGQGGGQDGVQGDTPTDPVPEGDDFASMYAQVDKSKKDPSMDGLDGDHLDEGLYATSMDDRPTVNPDGEYGTRMVENELYTL